MTKKIRMLLGGGIAMSIGACHSPVRLGMAGDESPQNDDSELASSVGLTDVSDEQIAWPIPHAKARQLIEAIPPGEALAIMINDEWLNAKGISAEGLLAAFHKQEQAPDQCLFVLSEALQESAEALQAYHAAHPQAPPTQLVPLHNAEDLIKVLSKSAAGAAGGKKHSMEFIYSSPNYYGFDNEVFSKEGWQRLSSRQILNAQLNIPSQGSDRDREWSCSPNSAARALCIWGYDFDTASYKEFKSRCPKTFGSPNTTAGRNATAIAGFLTLGIVPLIVCNLPDVGPNPSELAGYITDYLPAGRHASRKTYDSFVACANAIREDIDVGDPVIAFFVFRWDAMHYANVIGVRLDSSNANIISFALLDTTRDFKEVGYEEMRYQMHTAGSVMRGPYNLIRFYK